MSPGEAVASPRCARALCRVAQVALSLESILLSGGQRTREEISGLAHDEQRAVVIDTLSSKSPCSRAELEALRDEQLVELCSHSGMSPAASAPPNFEFMLAVESPPAPTCMSRTPTLVLVQCEEDAQDCWQSASDAAKEGCVEAARRENMLWRKMHFQNKKNPGRHS